MADLPENADLFALVVNLAPQKIPERPLPRWWGDSARALLLRIVQEAQPALANSYHDEHDQRPFTTSSLLGGFAANNFIPGRVYSLRFTALTRELCQILWQAAQPGGPLALGATVELEYIPFSVQAVCLDAEQHPWAGWDSYQAIMARCVLVTEMPARYAGLAFHSPTFFMDSLRSRKDLPFPLPELVYGSLLKRWNQFCSSLAFPEEVRRYASESMELNSFELRGGKASSKNIPHLGMLGKAEYRALHYDRYWMSLIHALGEYAFYSGVGAKTTVGMGQARRLVKRPGEKEAAAG